MSDSVEEWKWIFGNGKLALGLDFYVTLKKLKHANFQNVSPSNFS